MSLPRAEGEATELKHLHNPLSHFAVLVLPFFPSVAFLGLSFVFRRVHF